MALPGCNGFARGATIRFKTTFKDPDLNVVQPFAGVVRINAPVAGGGTNVVDIAMTPSDPYWLAYWDSRNYVPGTVFWSIHSLNDPDGIPNAVADGNFELEANAANPLNF